MFFLSFSRNNLFLLFGPGPYTIFAPTDAAFDKIPAADLQALTSDNSGLANALKYHVVNGEIFTFDLRTGQHLMSLNGHDIRVYSSPTVSVF